MLIFTNSYPCSFAHSFKRTLDRNQCQIVKNATQPKATKIIIIFVSLLMRLWPDDPKLNRGGKNGKCEMA